MYTGPFVPYITPAEFEAHPTYLDLDDLRTGVEDEEAQDAELGNILLMASSWCNGKANQPLEAHQVTQRGRARTDRDGNLQLVADNFPVLQVLSVQYGTRPGLLTSVADLSASWVEKGRILFVPLAGVPASSAVYVTWTYVAGWVSTLLAAAATAAASTLTVANSTGILPGTSYRLWEPGAEEMVTVAETWTPVAVTVPPTPTAVPLASPTLHAHDVGGGWSGMHPDLRLAVTNYAVSTLMRPDTSSEDSYPDTRLASGTRKNDPRKDGSGLVAEAERLLIQFTRQS